MKKVLMIREISEDYFRLPLEEYTLTFDGGLYSQYHYLNQFKKIKSKKIFFISTGLISTGYQSNKFVTYQEAHKKFFKSGDTEDFVTLDQIKEMKEKYGFEIGSHGHIPLDLQDKKISIVNLLMSLKKDSEIMITFFQSKLKIRPTCFCFPYNNEIFGYRRMLKNLGYVNFYGKERIDIKSLIKGK